MKQTKQLNFFVTKTKRWIEDHVNDVSKLTLNHLYAMDFFCTMLCTYGRLNVTLAQLTWASSSDQWGSVISRIVGHASRLIGLSRGRLNIRYMDPKCFS